MVCCWVCQMNEPFNVPCAWSTNLKVYDHIHPTYAFPGKDSVSVSLYAIEIYWIHSKPLRSGICFFLPPYSLKLIEKDLDFTPFFICASHSQDFNGMAPHTGAELFRKAHQVATNGRTMLWDDLGKRTAFWNVEFFILFNSEALLNIKIWLIIMNILVISNILVKSIYPGDFKIWLMLNDVECAEA